MNSMLDRSSIVNKNKNPGALQPGFDRLILLHRDSRFFARRCYRRQRLGLMGMNNFNFDFNISLSGWQHIAAISHYVEKVEKCFAKKAFNLILEVLILV